MARENVYAYTAPGLAPQFVSVNTEDGIVEIIVRSAVWGDETYGDTACAKITRQQAHELGAKLSAL